MHAHDPASATPLPSCDIAIMLVRDGSASDQMWTLLPPRDAFCQIGAYGRPTLRFGPASFGSGAR